MRKFINVCSVDKKKLQKDFSDLIDIDLLEDSGNFNFSAVSVFDHWLSREEASSLLQDVSLDEQKRRDECHYSFSKQLWNITKCLTFRVKGKGSNEYISFKKFSSQESFNVYVKPSSNKASSRFYFGLVLPDLDAIYLEGSDDTNFLYSKDPSKLEEIHQLANDSGLFVLT